MPSITQAPSPNFTAGRNGKRIVAIVDHITSGSLPGALEWLRNPAVKASAHYLVARDGNIYKLVNESDTAWHAGAVAKPSWPLYDGTNPNRYTVGIEHEGTDGTLTELQYQATLWLHRQLIAAYGLPIDTNHIIGHYRIDSVNRPNCPGPNFPWQRLFTDLLATAIIIAGSITLYGQLINSSAWGPMADVCKAKSIPYTWDAAKRIMCLSGASDANVPATSGVQIVAGSQVIAGQLLGGSTWAPVAAVLKALGIAYTWDASTRTMKF